VERHKLGRTVAAGDSAACAEQLIALLSDADLRADCAANAGRLAAEWSWERVAQPIFAFCERAEIRSQKSEARSEDMVQRGAFDAGYGNPTKMVLYQQNDEQATIVAELERHWRIAEPGGSGLSALLRRLVLRLLAPVFAEQRAFNAALVRLAYASIERERERLAQHESLAAQIALLHERCNVLAAEAAALHARCDTLGSYDGELNDRIARLAHVSAQLNAALATADEAQIGLAEQIAALRMRLADEATHA
jgi:hypothetical protein